MPTSLPTSRERGTLRILIVDDDEGNREVLAYFLRRQGFLVTTAASGEEALAAFDSADPGAATFGLVLLDVVMPGIGGLETLRVLRTRYSAAALPIIMVTGLDGGDDMNAALALEASDYVTKPYQLADALVRIEAVLARTDAARES
jgi:DNA-binding response OmpR family regulator